MPLTREDLPALLEGWPKSFEEAIAIQQRLRHNVERQDRLGSVQTVAGLDLGFVEGGTVARAAAVVLSFPDLELLDQAVAFRPIEFAYYPGLLSFRETPAALEALVGLRLWPDLLICDGQGIAHPRRFGLACHLGLLTDLPSIGCAKTRLTGQPQGELGQERGDQQPLVDQDEIVGVALRTRTGTRPVFVSTGHRISLPSAVHYVLACAPRYRLPETTRLAHRLASYGKTD
ncbi:MAG: endonuclease V [Herpetosiphonaceae bacterium]|nr:MAG: endonuclease V [Herpetosiphonaceae bacterium]